MAVVVLAHVCDSRVLDLGQGTVETHEMDHLAQTLFPKIAGLLAATQTADTVMAASRIKLGAGLVTALAVEISSDRAYAVADYPAVLSLANAPRRKCLASSKLM